MNFDHVVADLPQAIMNHTVLGFTVAPTASAHRATVLRSGYTGQWHIYWYVVMKVRLSLDNVVGAVEGLLLARLVALLFAARPDNWVFDTLLALTMPLVWPWQSLDSWAGQPRFGARLELATLAAMLVVALAAALWSLSRRRRLPEGETHG